MKKKGFTLIELLAVIIVLAVLALILTPMISDIISNASEAAFKRSIDGILSAAENYVTSYTLDNNGTDIIYPITFTCDGESCKDGNNNKLVFNGKVPLSGTVIIEEESIIADNLCDEKRCGSGSKNNLIVGNPSTPVEVCNAEIGDEWVFDYLDETNETRYYTFAIPCSGTYKLEAWGAQGGTVDSYAGGKGGYSAGEIELTTRDTLYIGVGGQGTKSGTGVIAGGYNGGGSGHGGTCNGNGNRWGASGGGATHIAKVPGELSSLEDYKGTLNDNGTADTSDDFYVSDNILIVAAGGGGAFNIANWMYGAGGVAGGLVGGNGTHNSAGQTTDYARGGTQIAGGYPGDGYTSISSRSATFIGLTIGSFGKGGNTTGWDCVEGGGGGGGFYGGGAGNETSGAGGSSYIVPLNNASIVAGNASMPTHDGTSTMTGNSNNGYAKITFVR